MPHRAFDHIAVRCPQLGGEVTFAYCRTQSGDLPCARALVCFAHAFPVEVYFRAVLKEATFASCFQGDQPDRVERLLRSLQEAQRSD